MSIDGDHRVYILLHQDNTTVTILGVFTDLQDANRSCLRYASEAGIDLIQASSSEGPDKEHAILPNEPARWDTLDGVSCWVESHVVDQLIP